LTGDRAKTRVDFGVWTLVIFCGHTLGMTVFVGLVALIGGIPIRSLFTPYVMLLYCGMVLSPLLYWVRISRDRPKTCAVRFAIAIFLYFQVFTGAVGYGAIRLRFISPTTAGHDYVPVLVFSIVGSVLLYVIAGNMLRENKS